MMEEPPAGATGSSSRVTVEEEAEQEEVGENFQDARLQAGLGVDLRSTSGHMTFSFFFLPHL